MIRVVGLSLVLAVAIALVFDAPGIAGVLFLAILGFFVFMLATGRMRTRCPNCGSRVKIGYNTCPNCRAQVASPRPLGAPKIDPMTVLKECEHCKSAIRPDASVCPNYQREMEAWTFNDGRWWRFHRESDTWFWYDPEHVAWYPAPR